jgi:Astacin (Peptidase family M12A)
MNITRWITTLGTVTLLGACQSTPQDQNTHPTATTVPIVYTAPTGERFEGSGVLHGEHVIVDGDMIFPANAVTGRLETQGNRTSFPAAKWPDGNRIPYKWDSAVSAAVQLKVVQAMAPWREIGIDFVYNPSAPDAVLITTPYPGMPDWVCGARVGYQGVETYYWAAPNCRHRDYVHEWGHILGYFHEHQRADRDQYVTVQRPNRMDPVKGQAFGAYDFDSIMHYDAFDRLPDGSIDYNAVIFTPKDNRSLFSFGFGETLSAGDKAMTRALYPEILNLPNPIPVPKRR